MDVSSETLGKSKILCKLIVVLSYRDGQGSSLPTMYQQISSAICGYFLNYHYGQMEIKASSEAT